MHTRRILAAALVAASLSAPAAAQTRVPPPRRPPAQRPPAQQRPGDEQRLRELVKEWADAAARADLQRLDRIQADNFAGSSEGRNFNKRELRAALRSGLLKVASWTVEGVKVEVRGNSAVVTGRSTLTNAVFMGDDFSGEYEWTDRFVKQRDGSWRAVSSHSKRVRKN